MKAGAAIGVVLVLIVAAVCVRLGFWQIARLHEKQALNAATAAALSEPPRDVTSAGVTLDRVRRRVRALGRYDETRQILLVTRTHQGSPGVEVVTPLILSGDSTAVLVDRGWLYAADAATAQPREHPEPGEREVVGLSEPMRAGAGGRPIHAQHGDSVVLYSARWLDVDSLRPRLPYALLPFAIRQLPGPGVPALPIRRAPEPLNEFTHVSYAVQWFLFAGILLIGTAILARSRRQRRDAPESGASSPIQPPLRP